MTITLNSDYDITLSTALLGYVGETNARPVTVEGLTVDGADRYVMTIDYGDGTVYDLDITGGTWTPTADILRVAQTVSCQISARKYDSGSYTLVKKSKIFSLRIGQCLTDGVAPIPPPSVAADALDRISEIGEQAHADMQKAVNAADTATTAAENAGKSATNAGVLADTATQAAERAETAQTSAETSATQAETARQQAVTAQNNAKISADIAATAAQQTAADKTAAAESTETAKSAAGSAAADRQAVSDMAKQVEADKTIVTESAAQVAADRTAAETAAETAQATAASIPEDYTAMAKKVDSNVEDVSRLKEDTAVLQKHQNVLVGNEKGNPVSCDDAFAAPLCGLNVYGKSTQDGTPTPDSPVPIVSAGDGGTIAVKMTGKNLLYIPDGKGTARGVTITSKNGIISISGTATEDGYVYLPVKEISIHGLAFLSSNVSGATVKLVSASWNVLFIQGKANNTQEVITRICFVVKKGTNYDLNGINVQLELGSTATAYSPYREQLLALSTPNGLPGIPVTSGGNYTDQTGQQWVCDEIDLERGVMVQRVDKTAFDTTKSLAEQKATLATSIEIPLTSAELVAYKVLTTYAPDTVVQASDGAGVKLDYQRDVNLVIKNLENAIASMTTT